MRSPFVGHIGVLSGRQLDCFGARGADDDGIVGVGVGAAVGGGSAVFKAEGVLAARALEGEEIQLVALWEGAVLADTQEVSGPGVLSRECHGGPATEANRCEYVHGS
jgi:hypothetical protein